MRICDTVILLCLCMDSILSITGQENASTDLSNSAHPMSDELLHLENLPEDFYLDVDEVTLSAGQFHTCVIQQRPGVVDDDFGGAIECWGDQQFIPPGIFVQVSAGHSFSCAITINDVLKCWGHEQIFTLPDNDVVATQVSSGQNHICILQKDKTIQCWGLNHFGEASPPSSGQFVQVRLYIYIIKLIQI